MDELTENAEEPDEGEKPEVQKLGKLQYKVISVKIFSTLCIYKHRVLNKLVKLIFAYR